MRSAIDEAMTDGLLQINPVTLVSASRYHEIDSTPNNDDYEIDPFTLAEKDAIYQEWQNMFRFGFNTGLRSSGLCALRWGDIDFIENPYQTRRTFATRHINQDVNLFWLAVQMGHKRPEMLVRHYGRYLAEYDRRSMIKIINNN